VLEELLLCVLDNIFPVVTRHRLFAFHP
jgi:hypothetical protein